MERIFGIAVLSLCWLALHQNGESQATNDATGRIEQFTAVGSSRLHALADLGRITKSTLLVEAGDIGFLEKRITLTAYQKTLDKLIAAIVDGKETYKVKHQGSLTIIYPVAPANPLNRILTIPLGEFSFTGDSVSDLDPYLAFRLREVTGCRPQGYAYAGPPMQIGIPKFSLPAATFEEVVEQVARASLPTMWVVLPDSGQSGCMSDPGSMWQVGLYSETGIPWPFQQSIGPNLVH
jgi:hypothetical protein